MKYKTVLNWSICMLALAGIIAGGLALYRWNTRKALEGTYIVTFPASGETTEIQITRKP